MCQCSSRLLDIAQAATGIIQSSKHHLYIPTSAFLSLALIVATSAQQRPTRSKQATVQQ